MKKIIIIMSILLVLFILLEGMYLREGVMYESLGFVVPLTAERKVTELKEADFFDKEELVEIHLSKIQAKIILKKIENNSGWRKTDIDERIDKKMEFYSRENIYDKIPDVENYCWLFVNRSTGVNDKYSVDEVLDDIYYSVSFAIFDIDTNTIYYYEYDR